MSKSPDFYFTKPSVYIIHSSTGPWRVLAKSVSHARTMASELEPEATVLRIEREMEWE